MGLSFYCLLLLSFLSITINGDNEPYYGKPIGSLVNLNQGNTHGDVYAADANTVIIVNYQSDDKPACTNFIASPIDRPSTETPKSDPSFRFKRQGFAVNDGKLVPQIQANNPNAHPLDWPFEFGHLTVEEESPISGGPSSPRKTQDPFDVELSKNDEEDNQNKTHVQVTVTPDPQSTVNIVEGSTPIEATSPHPVTRIRTVSTIGEEKTSAGPLLTLPPPAHASSTPHPSSTKSSHSTKSSPVHSSSIPTVVLSSVVLHSSVNTQDGNSTIPPAESVATDLPELDGSTESPPIGDMPDEDTSFEDPDKAVTLPAARKALWSRQTPDPTEVTEEPEVGDDTPPSTKPATQASSGAAKKKEKTKVTTDAATKSSKTTKEPHTGPGISWGDQPKSDQKNQQPAQWSRPANPPGQVSTSNVEQASANGIVWLGKGGPPTPAPYNQGPVGYPTLFPTGRPGKNLANRPVSILRQLPVEYFAGLNVPDELEGKSGNGTNVQQPSNVQWASGQRNNGPQDVQTIQFGGTRRTTLFPPTQAPQAPAQQSFRGLPPSSPAAPAAAPPGSQVVAAPVPAEAVQRRNISIDADSAFGNETDCVGKAWCVVADPHQHRTRSQSATTEAPPTQAGGGGDGSWYVVDDRRGRHNGTAQKRNRRQVSKISAKKPYQKSQKSEALQAPVNDGKQIYLLPQYDGNKIIIRIPNSHQLSDLASIGIYDSCKQTRLATIRTRNIQAPKEVELDGLRGWQFGVESSQVRILNCNSILFTNFTFNGAGKTEAFFYVGGGAYPFSITKMVQANVVGEVEGKPLKNYNKQDVLVRLPQGVRTMDITWLAVLSPKGTSHAHVYIPSSVVPPCDL